MRGRLLKKTVGVGNTVSLCWFMVDSRASVFQLRYVVSVFNLFLSKTMK